MSNKSFDSKMEELAKCWSCDIEEVDNLKIINIPFNRSQYAVCFSALDDDFALVVTQAVEDVSSFNSAVLCEVLKSNTMLNSFFSSFFIHKSQHVTNTLPLLYQAIFPYSQFSIPEAVKYIETYLEQLTSNMERINKELDNQSRGKVNNLKSVHPKASKEFTGLKI